MSVEQQQDNSHGGGAGRPRVAVGRRAPDRTTAPCSLGCAIWCSATTTRPGAALSEVRLAEHFDVRHGTPVREALKQLQVEGLVEIRPKVGTFVRRITRREIVEMFEVKEILEGMAARLMARRGQIPELDHAPGEPGQREIADARRRRRRLRGPGARVPPHDRARQRQPQARRALHEPDEPARRTTAWCCARCSIPAGSTGPAPSTAGSSSSSPEKDGVGAEIAMRDHVAAPPGRSWRTPPSNRTDRRAPNPPGVPSRTGVPGRHREM